ncbi:MAG TPA: hypothetical protein VLK32_05955 [Bacillota bacterium]|nr:hypothetical protein [Bacillota bacterium]
MSELSWNLRQLLAVTRELERCLADPRCEPDARLLEARALLVDHLRERVDALGGSWTPAVSSDLMDLAGELAEADRQLRRTAALRLELMSQAVTNLRQQRSAILAYLGRSGGSHANPYRLTKAAR